MADLQCADNAHSNNFSMSVLCESSGIWSNHTIPECLCDEGYRILNITGIMLICEGERKRN